MNLTKLISKSALLLLMSVFFAACNAETNASSGVNATGQDEENIAQNVAEEDVTTEDVAEDTKDLIGKTVTIKSNAMKQIEPTTFTVADQEFFGGENIVVVNATGTPFELPKDDTEVQVTGKVTKFVLADVESKYGLGLDPNLYVDYTDKPAIIAESLAIAPEPGEIAANPAKYYGKTLAVAGEVETVYSPNTFTLDEDKLFGGKDLLVLVTSPTETAIKDDETVAATGELRSFTVADLETDYDLTWDLDVQKQLEAEYTKRPVLVVEQVYPSAIPSTAK